MVGVFGAMDDFKTHLMGGQLVDAKSLSDVPIVFEILILKMSKLNLKQISNADSGVIKTIKLSYLYSLS